MKKITFIIALIFCCTMTSQAQINGSGYYRLRNVGNSTHYISLANHIFDYDVILNTAAGGLTNIATSDDAKAVALACAGVYLQTDIHMMECSIDDTPPSTIIYLENISDNNYDFIAEGTSLIALTTGVRTSGKAIFSNIYATIAKRGNNNYYTASVELKGEVQVPIFGWTSQSLGKRFFVDNNGKLDIVTSTSLNTSGYWYIEPVSSFNVNALVQHGDKFYATMYVPFAYKLSGCVTNAYAVSDIDLTNHIVTLQTVATNGETVPAGTPVVLECTSGTPSDNTLIPFGKPLACNAVSNTSSAPNPNTTTNYSGTNYLAGTYYCNTDGVDENGADQGLSFAKYNTTATGKIYASDVTKNVNDKMRVLHVSNGKIGFFKLSSAVKYMAANKAWLDISSIPASVRDNFSRFRISFNGIEDQNDEEPMVSEDGGFPDSIDAIQNGESHTIVYDLQGRRVSSENLTKGIYIINGKKVSIK